MKVNEQARNYLFKNLPKDKAERIINQLEGSGMYDYHAFELAGANAGIEHEFARLLRLGDSINDAVSTSTKKQITAILEEDGFEDKVDFNWAGNELVFRHDASRKRAEGLIPTKNIASSLGSTIVIKDSAFADRDDRLIQFAKRLVNALGDVETEKVFYEIRHAGYEDVFNEAMKLRRSGGSWSYAAGRLSDRIMQGDFQDSASVYAPIVDDDETIAEFDLDEMPSVDGEQKVKLHTGGKVVEVEVESEEHERMERLKDAQVSTSKWVKASSLSAGNTIIETFTHSVGKVLSVKKSGDGVDVKVKLARNGETDEWHFGASENVPLVDSKKLFKVKDKAGKEYAVFAKDSLEAVQKLKDAKRVADAVDLKRLASLINKAVESAQGKTVSNSGVWAEADGDSISVDCSNTKDVKPVEAIVKSVINSNPDARKELRVSSSSHEVFIEKV